MPQERRFDSCHTGTCQSIETAKICLTGRRIDSKRFSALNCPCIQDETIPAVFPYGGPERFQGLNHSLKQRGRRAISYRQYQEQLPALPIRPRSTRRFISGKFLISKPHPTVVSPALQPPLG